MRRGKAPQLWLRKRRRERTSHLLLHVGQLVGAVAAGGAAAAVAAHLSLLQGLDGLSVDHPQEVVLLQSGPFLLLAVGVVRSAVQLDDVRQLVVAVDQLVGIADYVKRLVFSIIVLVIFTRRLYEGADWSRREEADVTHLEESNRFGEPSG